MGNISSAELARRILAACLSGASYEQRDLFDLTSRSRSDPQASRALFGILVEGLADLFEPRLCDVYASLFAGVIAQVRGELNARDLIARYERVRHPAPVSVNPNTVCVLSRITLGADVAVTSVLLDAAKKRFPRARILFAGPRKNWELFAADPRIELLPCEYARGGTLDERLRPPQIGDGIVLDPDSRITQLGLIPVCPEERYFFFESRSWGGAGSATISELARDWTERVLGEPGEAYVAPLPEGSSHDVTVSLGVGENQEKRLGDAFEADLLRELQGRDVAIDEGGSVEEHERVRRAIAASGTRPSVWSGRYAPFASMISCSGLYVGYDSAGQHVAAAAGVPLISVFAGYVSDRMFQRWRPAGPALSRVIPVERGREDAVLARVRESIAELSLRPRSG